jgi:hypothetical protein
MLVTLGLIGLGVLLAVLLIYAVPRWYQARSDRTFMTHDDRGFKRALAGRGVIWDPEESIVRGPTAPKIEFVALDPATGKRRNASLLDPKTGSVNLRPQYCVPLPFGATTSDAHRVIVEARVQFSLNRDLLRYVYQLEDFSLALETRIQSAFRAEIGKRPDEVLRGSLHDVETAVVAHLRQAEKDGDEAGEVGVALGVIYHTASFTYVEADDHFAALASQGVAAAAATSGVDGAPAQAARAVGGVRGQNVLALKPQQLDQLADVFKGRDPVAAQAILTMLDMQTRQNIAEALAASGQLVVITGAELGLTGASAQREALLRSMAAAPGTPAASRA